MRQLAIAYGVLILTFGAMDACWLTLTNGPLYKAEIGELLAGAVRPGPAIAFYFIYLAGLLFFAVRPALLSGSWTTALMNGAVLGIVAYATYDLTNQATLKVWSMKVTIADLCWGAFASATASTVSYAVTAWTNRAFS